MYRDETEKGSHGHYLSLEQRVQHSHPLRQIWLILGKSERPVNVLRVADSYWSAACRLFRRSSSMLLPSEGSGLLGRAGSQA